MELEKKLEMKARNIWQICQGETVGNAAAILALAVHHLGIAAGVTEEENKRAFASALDETSELMKFHG